MAPVREVYTYTSGTGQGSSVIPLAPSSSSIGTTLTNTAEIRNSGNILLYDKRGNNVGKLISNRNVNFYENNNLGYVSNSTYLFNDGSYVMTLGWVNSNTTTLPPNAKYVRKAISTGGTYSGKEVTVTFKTDETPIRKIIFEYEK